MKYLVGIALILSGCYLTRYRVRDIAWPVGKVIHVEERGGKCFACVAFPSYIQGPAQPHTGTDGKRICFQDVRCEAEVGDKVHIMFLEGARK